jgi:hypothetical protein
MDKQQIPLFVEDYSEAIRATIQALGGFKRIGAELKPDMAVDAAGRWLSDCCNPDKREKLAPSELAYIRKRARAEGVHILVAYELREAGYAEPQPLEPQDERAALMRDFIKAQQGMASIVARMERMGGGA